MMFFVGTAVGALITFVVFAAFMAPKHWDWYHENIDLRKQLRVAVERAAHYQNLVSPVQWGPKALHEARIIKRREDKVVPWQGVELQPGESIDFVFDDIKDGGDR